ncbi:hypothetical protein [Sphingomonas sp. Leaf38]|uniref:hypothetical protein n=1 Tax=Sphingomonas sp. Leaf38 TaxID=1736217 RepID=UPI0006FB60B7|nr:hypothetical protein [Sphingomonas sp. Leaf38]KQN33152.1 hypothetical protein ASE88_04340 [Sphingomonas sp. Leaf38]
MHAIELIKAKRVHLSRLTNERGAAGELEAVSKIDNWIPRPRGKDLRRLLDELAATAIIIRGASFDAISCEAGVDFGSGDSIRAALPTMTFIEIKTANQPRVKPGFDGFFFAITESEISAADQRGPRHKVALFNRLTDELRVTNIPDILNRSRSMTWQLSVQL